jgi:mRNA interferase MazF
VVSNDSANKGSNRVSIVPLTSANISKIFPFEVLLKATSKTRLDFDSKAACDQVRSIDKRRFQKRLGSVSIDEMVKIKAALRIHFSL